MFISERWICPGVGLTGLNAVANFGHSTHKTRWMQRSLFRFFRLRPPVNHRFHNLFMSTTTTSDVAENLRDIKASVTQLCEELKRPEVLSLIA